VEGVNADGRSAATRDRERRVELAELAGIPLRVQMLFARHNRVTTDAAILKYNPRAYIRAWYKKTDRRQR